MLGPKRNLYVARHSNLNFADIPVQSQYNYSLGGIVRQNSILIPLTIHQKNISDIEKQMGRSTKPILPTTVIKPFDSHSELRRKRKQGKKTQKGGARYTREKPISATSKKTKEETRNEEKPAPSPENNGGSSSSDDNEQNIQEEKKVRTEQFGEGSHQTTAKVQSKARESRGKKKEKEEEKMKTKKEILTKSAEKTLVELTTPHEESNKPRKFSTRKETKNSSTSDEELNTSDDEGDDSTTDEETDEDKEPDDTDGSSDQLEEMESTPLEKEEDGNVNIREDNVEDEETDEEHHESEDNCTKSKMAPKVSKPNAKKSRSVQKGEGKDSDAEEMAFDLFSHPLKVQTRWEIFHPLFFTVSGISD